MQFISNVISVIQFSLHAVNFMVIFRMRLANLLLGYFNLDHPVYYLEIY